MARAEAADATVVFHDKDAVGDSIQALRMPMNRRRAVAPTANMVVGALEPTAYAENSNRHVAAVRLDPCGRFDLLQS